MSNEGKKILAFFLSGLILIGWMFMNSQQQKKQPRPQPAAQQTGSVNTNLPAPSTSSPALQTATSNKATKIAAPEINKTTTVLENQDIKVYLSNLGGYIEAIELKRYHREQKGAREPVKLGFADSDYGTVRWHLNINNQELTDRVMMRVMMPEQTSNHAVVFSATVENSAMPKSPLVLEKQYQLSNTGYVLNYEFRLKNSGGDALIINNAASMSAMVGSENVGLFNGRDPIEVSALVNEKRLHMELAKLKPAEHLGNSIPWAAIMDRYFIAAMLPTVGQASTVSFARQLGDQFLAVDVNGTVIKQANFNRLVKADKGNETFGIDLSESFAELQGVKEWRIHSSATGALKMTLPAEQAQVNGRRLHLSPMLAGNIATLNNNDLSVASSQVKLSFPTRSLAGGETTTYGMNLYFGPKDIDLITAVHQSLEESIDLGAWIGVIARPMLHFMKWSYGWIGNYGWAIILLTVLVRLLLYPLTHMQFRSMQKMQALKPHMDELRKRLENNKEELNRQMIELFKTQKVNPMGGCFPLILQMPVFFALYRVLYNAIELRHAPFALWLQDLSIKDPYYITPIILGGLMFIQQKMTPTTTMDPAQETMMKIMPIMFSVFMLYLPSGLVLYIMVSTVLGLLQQLYVQRKMSVPAQGAARS